MEFNDKQKAILEVAEKIISEKGFDAASIRDISKQANVNLAMVSYYFGSKEKLFEALFAYKSADTRLKLENLIQDNLMTNLEKMLVLADIYINKVFQNAYFHKIMYRENFESPIVFEQLKRVKNESRELISKILEEGIKNGEFNKNITVDHIISIVLGGSSHAILNEKYLIDLWNLSKEIPFADQVKDKFKSQIKYSLKAILTYNEDK